MGDILPPTMTLRPGHYCPTCGQSVTQDSTQCPACNHMTLRGWQQAAVGLLVVLAILVTVALGLMGCI